MGKGIKPFITAASEAEFAAHIYLSRGILLAAAVAPKHSIASFRLVHKCTGIGIEPFQQLHHVGTA